MNAQLRIVLAYGLLCAVAAPLSGQQSPQQNAGAADQAATAPSAHGKPAAPVIEARALALLKQNQQAMYRLHAYRAECRTIVTHDKARPDEATREYELATLVAAKPNLLRYDCWDEPAKPDTNGWKKPDTAATYVFACDGTTHWEQYGKIYRTSTHIAPRDMTTLLEPWGGFYTTNNSPYSELTDHQKKGELREARVNGREMVEGIPCDKVMTATLFDSQGHKFDERKTWYFGPDHLLRRAISRLSIDDQGDTTRDATLHGIVVDTPAASDVYAYTPPPGAKPLEQQNQIVLLANGTAAPDFTATDVHKHPVKLSDYRGKVVVLDFWASWCGPCMTSLPHTQQVIKKLRSEGVPVVLLAVDDGENREAFEGWVKRKRTTYSALNFVHCLPSENVSSRLFQVTSIPTQYVVDANGTVRASFVGYSGPTDDLEKAIRACLTPKSQ